MPSERASRTRQVQVCSCVLVLFAILYAVALTGCGGSGGSGSASGGSSSSSGSVSVLVPGSGQDGRATGMVFGRTIPSTTQSFLILIQQGGAQVAQRQVARTTQDQVVTIDGIPVGYVDIIVRALDSSGAVVAEAVLTNYHVSAGVNAAISMTLTPTTATSSPTTSFIYVLNGNGGTRSNKITTIAVSPDGTPTCVTATDVSLTSNSSAQPAGMVRWGTYNSPSPQATNYLYVANAVPAGGNVNCFTINRTSGALTNQTETEIAAGTTPSPVAIGPARNTTALPYSLPSYLYVLSAPPTTGTWRARAFTVGSDGSLTSPVSSNVFSYCTSISFFTGMTYAYLACQGATAWYQAVGGSLSPVGFESGVGSMSDSLVNVTASFSYVYFLDTGNQKLSYYQLGPSGSPSPSTIATSVSIPDYPYKMALVSRSDFPTGEQYLYIACSTSIQCYRLVNGVPSALVPATGYSVSYGATTLDPWGGLDTDPRGNTLWVTAVDDSNNSFVTAYNIAPQPGSTASPGVLLPWANMPMPVTDGAGNQMKGASTIIVKD